MNITIQVAYEVSDAAFSRVQSIATATEQHDINFGGDKISVERDDYTCLSAGEGHSDAARLFALVQHAIDNDFERDADGYLLVPFSEGGVVRMVNAE